MAVNYDPNLEMVQSYNAPVGALGVIVTQKEWKIPCVFHSPILKQGPATIWPLAGIGDELCSPSPPPIGFLYHL